MAPSIGDAVPSITLEQAPDATVDLASLCAPGTTVVLFAVPGAFTPTCSATHLPGFVAKAADFKGAGADEIVCVTPNDVFVAAAWAASVPGAADAVTVLADKDNALARAWDVVLDAEGKLGTKRIKRLSAVIKDGKIAALNVEPDGGGATCSLADPTLAQLKAMQ